MRNLALIGMVWAGTTGVPAQPGFIVHFDSLQNGKGGAGESVFEVDGGYLLFTEQVSHDGSGKTHLFVRKLNALGQLVTEREYVNGDPRHYLFGYIAPVCPLDTGGFASAVLEGSDYWAETWLYRFNQQGDTTHRRLLFTYPPQDSLLHFIRQTRQTSDGGFILAGFLDRPNALAQALLVRVNANGDTLWSQAYGQSVSELNDALGVAVYGDGGYLISGYRLLPFVLDQSFLIRTDPLGNELWRREYGNRASVNGAVRVLADGHIVTWSEYREQAWPSYWQQVMLTKWDANGGIVWQKRSHYNYYSSTTDFEVLADGSFIGTGSQVGEGLIAKFSPTGDSLWSRTYDVFHSDHQLYDVTPTSDGGFILCGRGDQNNLDPTPGLETIYVVKTDSLGCVVPGCHLVGVSEYAMELQEHLKLWPNPATDHLRLELELPAGIAPQGAVQAVLLDATGREVLRERVRQNGNLLSHSFTLSPFPPGLYHLHLADEKRWLAGGRVVVSPP
ncbi:MAG: hypothetical protein GFGODING_02107 [Flavobacteriales bacterium]|nr:hypothetical protein [Flavobacteriales bacterium]